MRRQLGLTRRARVDARFDRGDASTDACHWNIERVIPDAPSEFWDHSGEVGVSFQLERRLQGRPLVDDPWRAVKELVVGTNGLIRLT